MERDHSSAASCAQKSKVWTYTGEYTSAQEIWSSLPKRSSQSFVEIKHRRMAADGQGL